jgi:hypothetical protein
MRLTALACLVSILLCAVPAPAPGTGHEPPSGPTAWTFIRAFMEKIVNAPPEKGFFERVLDFLREVGFFGTGKKAGSFLPDSGETSHA